MGLNVDNLFVQGDYTDRMMPAIGAIADGSRNKFSHAPVSRGWTQIIEAHGSTPPDFAAKLSLKLGARVVCAQIYEVSGDAALHLFEHGDLVDGWTDDDAEDPGEKVRSALRAKGIDAPLLTFRETVNRTGWILETIDKI